MSRESDRRGAALPAARKAGAITSSLGLNRSAAPRRQDVTAATAATDGSSAIAASASAKSCGFSDARP
jgi:hypothetical protein